MSGAQYPQRGHLWIRRYTSERSIRLGRPSRSQSRTLYIDVLTNGCRLREPQKKHCLSERQTVVIVAKRGAPLYAARRIERQNRISLRAGFFLYEVVYEAPSHVGNQYDHYRQGIEPFLRGTPYNRSCCGADRKRHHDAAGNLTSVAALD